jgi:tRNA U38,U39,U40 pseudouridine synthase TruA
LEAGLGRRTPQDIEALLDPKSRNELTWPVVLPAKGLTLMKIRYGPHPKDNREKNEVDA